MAAKESAKKCAVSSEFCFADETYCLPSSFPWILRLANGLGLDFRRSLGQGLVIEPVSRQPQSQSLLAFQARKILGTRLVSLTRFRSKTDDLMENSRGKRCALDIQDCSQIDKLDVHLS